MSTNSSTLLSSKGALRCTKLHNVLGIKHSWCYVTSRARLWKGQLPSGSFTLELLLWQEASSFAMRILKKPWEKLSWGKPRIAVRNCKHQLTVMWMNLNLGSGSLSPSQAFRWLQPWPTPWLRPHETSWAKLLLNPWPKESVRIINCCFKPLNFGVICYAARANKYNPFWCEHWGYTVILRSLLTELFFLSFFLPVSS